MTTGSSYAQIRPLTPVIVIFLLIGLSAGGIDVSFVAAAGAWNARTYAGLMLACISLGSGVAGFIYGSHVWRRPLAQRFVLTVSALTVSFSLLFLARSPLVLAPLAVLAGCAIAPSIINGNSLVQHFVPAGRLTEGFALIGAGLGVGNSIGASVAGKMIDRFDYHGGFSTVVAGGAIALIVTLSCYRTIASRDSQEEQAE
jgi:MFS family permease